MTAQALRVARSNQSVRDHPWLIAATQYCFDAISRTTQAPFAYVLCYALMFLDIASDTHPEAHDLLDHLGRFVPEGGTIPLVGGRRAKPCTSSTTHPSPNARSENCSTPGRCRVIWTAWKTRSRPMADGRWTSPAIPARRASNGAVTPQQMRSPSCG